MVTDFSFRTAEKRFTNGNQNLSPGVLWVSIYGIYLFHNFFPDSQKECVWLQVFLSELPKMGWFTNGDQNLSASVLWDL